MVALIASFHISHGRAIRFLVWSINPRHKSSAVDIVHCIYCDLQRESNLLHPAREGGALPPKKLLHSALTDWFQPLSTAERFLFDGTRLKGVGIEIDPKSIARAPFSSQITSPYKSISYKICV